MATGKKSVLLYCDIIHTVEKLSDVNAGKLFKHYLRYINDLDPKPENEIIDLVFEPIKQNLKRDLKKWEKRAETSRLNGSKGGRPKTQKTQRDILKPKKPVIVKDKVNVIVNDILLEKETKELFNTWLEYRKEIKKAIKSEKTIISLAKKIQTEGFEKSKQVITTSIENGWQGLFWNKTEQKKAKTKFDSGLLIDKMKKEHGIQ